MDGEIRIYDAVKRRYSDAYSQARMSVTTGYLIKYASGVLGILLVVSSLIAAKGTGILAGITFAVLTTLWIYSVGANVVSQGQLLLALLDTAVNSFRGLSDAQRVEILSLDVRTPRPIVKENPGGGVPRDPIPEMPDDQVWVCKECIRRNPLSQTSCRLCGAPRL